MYIGHFAIAYILIRFFPDIHPLVSLIGVSFPDILWPIFIWLGFEKAEINPDSPLQKYVKFTSYPYSHSLIVSFVISGIVGLFFVIGTIGHLINANSFFRYSKTNPFKSAKQYAVLALTGFIGFSLIANYVLGG